MRFACSALVVVLLADICFAAPRTLEVPAKPAPPDKVGLTDSELKEITDGLEKNLPKLLEGETDTDPLNALAAVQYDRPTWKKVKAYLDEVGKPSWAPAGLKKKEVATYHRLYLIRHLTAPLKVSKPEVICSALDALEHYLEQYSYADFPNWQPGFITACQMPKNVPPVNQRLALDNASDNQQKKMAEEIKVQVHNALIGDITDTYLHMLAYAQDSTQDEKLMKWLLNTEETLVTIGRNKFRRYEWRMAVDALGSEVPTMSAYRAKKVYDALTQIDSPNPKQTPVPQIKWKFRQYLAQYQALPSREKRSKFLRVNDHPGCIILALVNNIAVAKNLPTVVVPDPTKNTGDSTKDADGWSPPRWEKEAPAQPIPDDD